LRADDQLIIKTILIKGGSLHILRMENKFLDMTEMKQFDYVCLSVDLNQNVKQIVELRFSKGGLFYTKCGIFGLSSNFEFQESILIKSPPDQVKSSNLNIEHQPEFADQWSPSSSEDG
jgi:hypothetical protein